MPQLKAWKQHLGCSHPNQIIVFDYPASVVHKTFRHIQKDILRTYPQSPFFCNNKANLQNFQKVLQKLAVYFPKTGYTQGINFLAGFFIISGQSINQSFTICSKMFTNYDLMLLGMYEDQFPLNRLYCSLVWEYLATKKSKIKALLNSFSIFDDLWLFQWFATFFIYSFPFQTIPILINFLLT